MQHYNQSDVLIIGAGISGLMAATKLEESGCSVTVLDKGRNYGGRMATRTFDEGIFDHGAQFFTVRQPIFKTYVDQWSAADIIRIWFESASNQSEKASAMDSTTRHE